MEKVEQREDWYLFDPHEVRQVMGYSLEDFYDEEKGQGTWRTKYNECVQSDLLTKVKVPAIDRMQVDMHRIGVDLLADVSTYDYIFIGTFT